MQLGWDSQPKAWEQTITKIAGAVEGESENYKEMMYAMALRKCKAMR